MARETPVGMIGLGLMGSALSARLIDAGIGVIGFDIDAAKTDGLRASGAEFAAFAADVAARCRTIVIAVYDAAQVRTLLPDLANATPPPRVICTTTCAPGEIVAIAEFASRSRLAFIEAPISGTSAEVRAGTATALVAGDADVIDAAAATLDILCPQRVNVGAIGNASRTKLAINLILQNNRAALAEGIALAEALGLDGAAFLATARQSAAYSAVMDSKGPKMLGAGFLAAIAHRADLEGCRTDPAGGRPARPALAADLGAGRTAARGDRASRGGQRQRRGHRGDPGRPRPR
ncbi:putative dehydrogenase [Bradyrhizobium elkanii]